jgi:carbon monoxide dehydrogenase subunit G
VFARLVDLGFLVQCIPDVKEVREVKDTSAALTVRPGFSFVRGELKLDIAKLAETPGTAATFSFKSKGIGTSSTVEAAFTLEDAAAGTLLKYAADLKEVGGLLKAAPKALLSAAANKVINDLLTGLEKKLGAE